MRSRDVLPKLEEIYACLSKVDQSYWKSLIWVLKPSMFALIHDRLLEHPWEEVKLIVSYCLSTIVTLTSHAPLYNDVIMNKFLQLIVECYQGLDEMKSPTFGNWLKILELMEETKSYNLMFDL